MLQILLDKKKLKLVLASQSPRRRELLESLNVEFEIRTKNTDESFPDEMPPSEVPVYLAKKKADALFNSLADNEMLITSDTIVCIDNSILNKPQDRSEAIKMIQMLQSKTHRVYTGVCLTSLEKQIFFYDRADVSFAPLEREEIEYYVDNFKPFDKAGAYGIQEWIGYAAVEKLEGSFYTVMGLPTQKLYSELKKFLQ